MIIVSLGSDELPLEIQSISVNGKETYASEARFDSVIEIAMSKISITALKRREIIAVNIGH